MIKIDLCLSQIPKDCIKQDKKGRKWIQLIIQERREKDKQGNTHSVSISMTKEERQSGKEKVYVGSGLLYEFTQPENVKDMPPISEADDLPF